MNGTTSNKTIMMTPRVKSLLAKKKKANHCNHNNVNNLSVPPFSMVDENVHTGDLADSCTSLETDDWNVDGIENLKDGGRSGGTAPITSTSASSKRSPWSSSSSTLSLATAQPPESPTWSTPRSRRKVFSKSRIASLESLSRAVVPQQQQQKPNASKRGGGGLWNIFSSFRDLKVERDHEDDDHQCVQLQAPPTPTTCTTPSSSSRRSVDEDMTKMLRQHQRIRRNMLDSSPTPPRTTVTRTAPSSTSPLMKRAPSLRRKLQCDDDQGNHRPTTNDHKNIKKPERMVRRGSITQYNLDDSIDTLQVELLAFSFCDGSRVQQQLQPQQ